MRRRGRGAGGERARDQGGKALNALNTPFAGLEERLRALPRPAPPPPTPRVEEPLVGLDPRVLRRLRRGDFAWQDHLDLHGMTSATARVAVDRFLAESVALGHRCVLIVHGRGRNSKDQTPVLKERLKSWLARGRAARIVLGFTTARPCDGGAG